VLGVVCYMVLEVDRQLGLSGISVQEVCRPFLHTFDDGTWERRLMLIDRS
jgi:hypothetical protein